jgi:hypothetical protein
MFVRVKKIGPYEYLHLVARAAAMSSASSRHSDGGTPSRTPTYSTD